MIVNGKKKGFQKLFKNLLKKKKETALDFTLKILKNKKKKSLLPDAVSKKINKTT